MRRVYRRLRCVTDDKHQCAAALHITAISTGILGSRTVLQGMELEMNTRELVSVFGCAAVVGCGAGVREVAGAVLEGRYQQEVSFQAGSDTELFLSLSKKS